MFLKWPWTEELEQFQILDNFQRDDSLLGEPAKIIHLEEW
jgi:hypothetical protein